MSESMAQGTKENSGSNQSKSVLPVLAEICEEEDRWVDIDPPTPEQDSREPDIKGNWVDREGRIGEPGEAYPINVGFLMDTRENSDDVLHKVYRTSKYNVHYRLKQIKVENLLPRLSSEEREEIEAAIEAGEFSPDEELAIGQVFVREADGYDK